MINLDPTIRFINNTGEEVGPIAIHPSTKTANPMEMRGYQLISDGAYSIKEDQASYRHYSYYQIRAKVLPNQKYYFDIAI